MAASCRPAGPWRIRTGIPCLRFGAAGATPLRDHAEALGVSF